jgi:hypothetical protein
VSPEVFDWLYRSSRGIRGKAVGRLSVPVVSLATAKDTKEGIYSHTEDWMSESKKTSDDGSIESRGLKA